MAKQETLTKQGGDLATISENTFETTRNDKDASKAVARRFNLPGHSSQHITVYGLSLQQGNMESRKNREQKFIFKLAHLIPTVSTNPFR